MKEHFATLEDFLRHWNEAERKAAIIDELRDQGVLLEELREKVGKDLDAFDLICHVVFDQPPLTRRERANNVKKRHYFAKYGEQARRVLETLLEKYADTGIENIEDIKILTIDPFSKMGTASELVSAFGGKQSYLEALAELVRHLYAS